MQTIKLRVHIILLMTIYLAACATGSSIVTGTVRPPIDFNLIQLYTDAPENYETIGIVKASSGAGWTEQDSVNYAIEELKKQAAKLGANGVLLSATGESTSSVFGTNANGGIYAIPVSEQTVTGKAIYIAQ